MIVCENCKEEVGNSAAVTLIFSSRSILGYSATSLTFCSDECGVKWCTENWVKKYLEFRVSAMPDGVLKRKKD